MPPEGTSIKVWISVLEEWKDLFKKKIQAMDKEKYQLTSLQLEKMEEYHSKYAKCEFLIKELGVKKKGHVNDDEFKEIVANTQK